MMGRAATLWVVIKLLLRSQKQRAAHFCFGITHETASHPMKKGAPSDVALSAYDASTIVDFAPSA